MDKAEAISRKNRKPSSGTDALARAARLRALEKKIGTPIRRHRDPGGVTNTNPFVQGKDKKDDKDQSTIVMRGF